MDVKLRGELNLAKLKSYNFHGWETLVNRDLGFAPYFTSTVRRRIKKKQATNIVVTGEAGIGKTYQGTDIARILEGLTLKRRDDRFTIDQVVFTYKGFMEQLQILKMGKVIVFDEPSYAISKRDWYKDLNKALVKTIESFRFKVHPLIIPVLNKALLDRTIRSYLLQFQVEMRDRGQATVYRLYPSQSKDKIYRYFFCDLRYGLFDNHLCKVASCLGCKKVPTCMIFRAQYERKKAMIQDQRYEEALTMAKQKDALKLTNIQVAQLLHPLREHFVKEDGSIDVGLMRIIASTKLELSIGQSRGYNLRKNLQVLFPNDFP